MKILYGITKSNFGGAQRYVYELAREATRQGHDVAVLCGGDGPLVQKLKAENIKVITLCNLQRDISLVKEIKSFVEIIKVLNREKPYIFHINSSKMGAMGTLAGKITGVKKVIFTAHGWAFNEPRPKWQKIILRTSYWIVILLSRITICVSEKTKKNVSGWPFIQNKLVLIRNGLVEFDLLPRKEAREKLVPNISSDTLLVASTSELHKIKGLDVLLTAWSKFVKMRDAKLVLISDGDERVNLENMANNIGIYDSIIFKGYLDNARAYLSGPDIFVMPSRSEALPYAPLEAGFAGLPVIATSVGGIPEIIESGINGILVPPEDAEVIFSSLVLLSEDEALRKRLGTNLKASIQENFTFEKMAHETFELYK
jgi:glycosyltransferase involved in cell wall biosynthesis